LNNSARAEQEGRKGAAFRFETRRADGDNPSQSPVPW
jgi:hypothetical protein